MYAALKCAVYAGLVAGTIDIVAASIINTINPLIVLLAIASGLLSRAAFHGGPGVMLLGLVLQWLMSIVIAAVFTLAATQLPALARRWRVWGAVYGVVVFGVMNFIVVPLSAAPHKTTFSAAWVIENLLAMLLFGWIIAFASNRFLVDAPPTRTAVLR